ncbi:hypothetical protein DFH27DRAFT_590396 [Peziza echinospora]|nr:hypothetical protein DFH27DRAFT_590396 [Peziza echinospora]
MEFDPKTPPYLTGDQTSFAYISARDRWPVILTQAINDIFQATRDATEPTQIAEGKKIVEHLAKLKYELQHDRVITPLEDDGEADIAEYNKELEALGNPKWFNCPWLFAECYLYRRIQTYLSLTESWKSYDVFHKQKVSTFKSSLPAVLELTDKYLKIVSNLASAEKNTSEEAEEILFTEMMEICLWGNATDLSLLTSLTYEDIQKLQGSEARKRAEKNILANDLQKVYRVLKDAQINKQPGVDRRVDIVLDNSGFELFVDLILAGYLLSTDLATTIILHPKSLPWFVSDVLPTDFIHLLTSLSDPRKFFSEAELTDEQASSLKNLFANLSTHYAEGRLLIRPNRFWTTAHSFHRLPAVEKSLKSDLDESELVIFKGDLNYRKLTADAVWPATTPFREAIGAMKDGVRVLALRTCKADVVVGLQEGVDEKLRQEDGDTGDMRKWAWSGKWAVVQFSDGKAGN